MTPIRVLQIGRPFAAVAQVYWMVRRREHERTGIEHVRQRARVVLGVRRKLGKSGVAGCLDEFLETAGSSLACGRSSIRWDRDARQMNAENGQ